MLGLRDEDIASIKQLVLAPKQPEYERQQEIERLRRERERAEYQRQQAELPKQPDKEPPKTVPQPPSPPGLSSPLYSCPFPFFSYFSRALRDQIFFS